MVFEAVVSSQLNKFLGAYIENLNSSQLKLGLLGGDVVLNKLILKQSALDDLNLPVKTVAGHIGELVLKIPWTNIYAARTQVTIKGLYLLAVPNQAVVFDPDKEQIAKKEAKAKQLALIEEAKIRELAVDSLNQEDDGFVAKLAAHILQNLLVTVEDVHIRYEDNITNPQRPFAVGITLKKLALESTDSSWNQTLVSEPSKQFFKLLSLESLAVYWLSNATHLISQMRPNDQVDHFRRGIADARSKPFEDSYIAGPITSYAKLRINTRPELDGSNYTTPKIFLNLTMEEISMGLTPHQYEDIVQLLNNIERMNRAQPYRKYRPVISSYKNYAKIWWLFAYQCILEVNVRRRRRNWRWTHMKQHREWVRRYIRLYKTKLTLKKEDPKLNKSLEDMEEFLDVFNITLARRQAEVQVDRIRTEQRLKEEAEAKQGGRGWFSGWFGGGATTTTSDSDGDANSVVKSLQAEMTPTEKAKLYSAIGYEENAVPAIYPKSFVENRFEFFLKKLVILLHDSANQKQPIILLASLSKVEAKVEQRPVAQALQVSVRVGDFLIDGSRQEGDTPKLVRPLKADRQILNLFYETNPLDESCHQRLKLVAEPLVISYDVHTLRQTSAMFQSNETSQLSQLQAAARQKLEALKKTSSLGLEYAIQNHAIVDVDIKIKGSFLILPYGGCMESNGGKVLCNMGNFFIKSLDLRKQNEAPKVSQMVRVGSTEEDILKEMLSHSYDKFSIGLQDVRVISVLPMEDWTVLVKQESQDHFILKPMSINLIVEKCLLLDDPRLPKLKISGQLPSIHIDVVDTRLVNMAAVLKSIPSPSSDSGPNEATSPSSVELSAPVGDDSALEHLDYVFKNVVHEGGQLVQATELLMSFEFKDIRMSLSMASQQQQQNAANKPVLVFFMENLEMVCANKTFETVADLKLKDLVLEYVDNLGGGESAKNVTMINSRDVSKELLSIHFVDVNKQSPEFHARHKSVLKKLDVLISSIAFDFHQEAVIDLMHISNDIGSRIEAIAASLPVESPFPVVNPKLQPAKALASEEKEKRRRGVPSEVIDFQLTSQFDNFRVNMLTRKLRLMEVTVSGLAVDATVRASHTVFRAGLDEFWIINPNGGTLYREIASIVDGQALQLDVKIFNGATENENYVNMDAVDLAVNLKMSRLKAVYLSSVVRDVLAFVNHFQAAKEALIEASSAAAEAAKQNVQRAYVQATRILLDIEFQAPYIIVPQTSTSTEALIIDLGHLTMKNRFELRSARNEIGTPAIMDAIGLNLEELRIYLAVVQNMKVSSERALINPLTFSLNLIRNLSTNWYTEEPDLSVDVQLGKVAIILSQTVYGKVMQIVFDNLEEGQPHSEEPEPIETIKRDHVSSSEGGVGETLPSSIESPLLSSQSSDLSADSILQRYAIPRVSIAFGITLAEIKVELIVNVAPKKEMTYITVERPLSRLALQGFNVSGRMMSDNSIHSKIILHSFLIEDTRPLLQTIPSLTSPTTPTTPSASSKRLVERPISRLLHLTESQGDQKQMLSVSFERNKEGDSKVNVHLCGFTLILCPNYMLRLLNFFTAEVPTKKAPPVSAKPTKTTNLQPVSPQPVSSGPKKPIPPSLMTVVVTVDRPDIFLVERIDSLNTKALVLNMEMKLTLLMMPQVLDLSGEVSGLNIFSCLFDPAVRHSTKAAVLSPCRLMIKAKMSDDEHSSQVDVNIGDVTLSVSPGTIEMLANVSKSMTTPDDEAVEGETEGEEESTALIWSTLWDVKPLKCFNFSFLETEVGVEAYELSLHDGQFSSTDKGKPRREQMIVVVTHFTMMIETGQGNRTSPLILVESEMSAKVANWSSTMEVGASLSLQAAYYNSLLALWEPLLEPVDCSRAAAAINQAVRQRPWELAMRMKKHVATDIEAFEFENRSTSKLEIAFESADTMELTVTRTFLDVVSMLGSAFSDAVNQQLSKRETPASLYVVHNQLDKTIVLDLINSEFVVDDPEISNTHEMSLEPNSKVGLKVKAKARTRSVLNEQESENERIVTVKIPQLGYSHAIPVSRSSRRYLPVGHRAEKGQENVGVVADICNDFGFRSITFRGVVQIRNHFPQPIDVYFMTKTGNEVNQVGRVDECSVLNVPLFALYTPTGELFFSPVGYGVSITPFVWRDLQRQNTISKILMCSPRQRTSTTPEDPFFMQVTGNVEHIYMEDTRKKTLASICYEIHLRPTVILHNSLSVPLHVFTCGTVNEVEVPPGGSRFLAAVEPGSSFVVLKLKNYMERDWACKEEIRPSPQELVVWSMVSYDGAAKGSLDLGVFSVIKEQMLHMTVYCPFWMINNTGLLLTYKHTEKPSKKAEARKSFKRWASAITINSTASIEASAADEDNWLYHPSNMTGPVLFSFRPKSFFGKKTAMIRVEDSNWSDRFALDAAGSSGLVTCKAGGDGGMCYQLGVTVQLSHQGLTKQVIFTPYYILSNLAPFDVDVCEVREVGPRPPSVRRDWISVTAGKSVPFWPHGAPQSTKWVIFRVASTTEETLALSLDDPKPTMLRLNNGYGGLFIDFQVSESSVVIVCHPYEDGRAPILLVNHTADPVYITESGDGSASLQLSPHHACFFTWRHPNGARSLTWGSGGGRKEVGGRDVLRSGSGVFDSPNGLPVQWVSFLHGRQRILLFTVDESLAVHQRSLAIASEPVEQSITVTLHGLGVSLVDNIHHQEILYAGITSSGVIWETAKMNKSREIYRAMSIRHNALLEEAFQQYTRSLAADPRTSSRRELDGGRLIVDFKELKVYKPKEKHLRRSYRSGVELLYENYCNRRLIHARLNKLQIDNQLEDCVFPIVFAPVPPPKSVATESIPHPFVEISIVELLGARQDADVPQYEYFKLLVQECHIRVDMSLVNAVGGLFVTESELKSEQEHRKNFELDMESAEQGLHERTRLLKGKAPENYFKTLHLSPLKIHLSFSYTGTGGGSSSAHQQASNNPATQLINLLIQSVGISLTEVQDVVFRLGYFERNDVFFSWPQLARDLQWHYTGQAVKQFYVLVFGLDVIGNPFGLALGISQGVEQLFYEPFQGAIQGPGEFVEGLALGARSLIGHTVGGMAGAASRIAGTLGKGLSYLTFDEDYQKNRRETLLRRPTDIGENLAQGGKGLLMGVVEGVSGVVMRPIEGAQQQGVGGFFAGIGKGVVGLVTRPTAAIADFASGSLDAMKKAADVNEELSRLRPPRFLHPDGIVRPYIYYQAYGDSLLKALDKGRFSKTDHYVDHVITDSKAILLVTDRRLLLMSLDLFGQWQVDWSHTWEELAEPPLPNPNGLFIPLRQAKKVLGLFASHESGKLVAIQSQEKCEIIRRKVEKLMRS